MLDLKDGGGSGGRICGSQTMEQNLSSSSEDGKQAGNCLKNILRKTKDDENLLCVIVLRPFDLKSRLTNQMKRTTLMIQTKGNRKTYADHSCNLFTQRVQVRKAHQGSSRPDTPAERAAQELLSLHFLLPPPHDRSGTRVQDLTGGCGSHLTRKP